MCLPSSFLLLLATQAQLYRTVDSPWTADEKLRQHILRLLSPRLISKNGVLSFLFQHLVSGGGRERIRQRGGDAERGEDSEQERKERWGNAESKTGARE